MYIEIPTYIAKQHNLQGNLYRRHRCVLSGQMLRRQNNPTLDNGGSSCKICIFLIKLAFVVPHNYRSARPVAAYRTPTGRQGRSASRQCQCCQYQNFLGIKYLQYLLKCFNAFQHSGQHMKRNLIYLPQLWESYAPSRSGSDSTALKDAVSTVKKVLMKE